MRIAGLIFFMALLMGISNEVVGQSAVTHKPTLVDARIEAKGYVVEGNFVIIKYYIPYNGMVEIRLFNEAGEKIWQNQYAHAHGDNIIRLRAAAFEAGEVYNYTLNYKTDEVSESLIVPYAGSD